MTKLMRLFLTTLFLLGQALHAYDIFGFTPNQIIEYKQTVDSNGDPVALDLHVFTPEDYQTSDSRPAIVFFFGGGWNSGSPSQFHPHCQYLASRGMVAISAEYRVKNVHGTSPQECVKDGKSAVRYLRKNAAALGIDPDRILAGGGSAGGHVAAATATLSSYEEPGEDLSISSRPNALVLFNPVYDNGPNGYGHSRVQNYWEDISPLHNIGPSIPPAVVFLGTDDSLIPVATAKDFQTRMETEGVRSDLHLYQDQPHGFFNYDQPDDDKGPYLGYSATVFAMDAFLVSLGYLDEVHPAPDAVTGWVSIFGDAGFASGSEATSSPVTTDADADAIAANIASSTLNDGDFVRLTGSVTVNAPLSGQNFRIGLYDGDDPATADDGTGYAGIWAEAPDTVAANIASGDGTGSSHPFETSTAAILGTVPAAEATVPVSTEISFTLMLSRNGNSLDLTARFTDGSAYDQEQNLLNQTLTNYNQNAVAFLMTGNLDATQASFSDVEVTRGRTLLDETSPPETNPGVITYVDAQEGTNTYANGGSLVDQSWLNTANLASADDDQWMKRSGGNPGWSEHNGGDVLQAFVSGFPNDVPEIVTEVTGLDDGEYDVWAFFWEQVTSDTQNWVLDTGLSSGALDSYSSPVDPVGSSDSSSPINAATLDFSNDPAVVGAGGNQNMFGVYLGKVSASEGRLEVYVDKLFGTGSGNRTIYDGIGFSKVESIADTDGDGLPDAYEQSIIDADGGDSVESFEDVMGTGAAPAVTDFDGDGADDGEEYAEGTDPLDEDSDNDGLLDGVETDTGTFTGAGDTGTDPLDEDSDGDGLLDGVENNSGTFLDANQTGTDPNDADSDGDSLSDGYEVTNGSDPTRDENAPGTRILGVDFNRSDAFAAPSQSLFRIISGSTTQADNDSSYTKTIGSRQVTVNQPGGVNFEFSGANGDNSRAIPGGDTSLSFLVADFIASREGALDIEITGLPAGGYFFRSYHLDTFTGSALGFAQGNTNTTRNTIEAEIGGVLQTSVQPNALGAAGLDTTFIADSQVPTLGFYFSHDGSSPLVIQLRAIESNGSDTFLLLNGFEIFLSDTL